MSWSRKRPTKPGLYHWRLDPKWLSVPANESPSGLASFKAIKSATQWHEDSSTGPIVSMTSCSWGDGLGAIAYEDGMPFNADFSVRTWSRVEWWSGPVSAPKAGSRKLVTA